MNAPIHQTEIAAAVQTAAAASELDRLLQQPRNFSPQDLLQGDNLDRLERIAERMSSGRMTVPEYLRGNVGDCMAIAMQAMLWNMDPFAVAQKTHIVSGRLGYEAQLVNAVLQNSGAVRGLPRYEYRGDGQALECRVGFVPHGEVELLWTEWLATSQITTKNSPLWKVNPRQQIGYLQVKNWARAFAPGAILGVYTVDELEDFAPPVMRTVSAPSAAPAPAPVATAAPTWPADAFTKQLARWAKAVEEGIKTPDDILTMARSKGALTQDQEAQINALKPAQRTEDASIDDDFVTAMEKAEAAQ